MGQVGLTDPCPLGVLVDLEGLRGGRTQHVTVMTDSRYLMAKGEQPDQQLDRGREVCVDVINMRRVFNGLLLGTHSGAWQRSNKHH